MFTGLIEEIGTIGAILPIAGGKKIEIICKSILDDVAVNDSVAVDGVCLTATAVHEQVFLADAVGETLNKSTLASVKSGLPVNLERALRLSDRLGGHLVQGHVNGIADISKIVRLGENYLLEIRIPDSLRRYVIDEGSIAVNGISLTIAAVKGSRLEFSIIPHTWKNTTLAHMSVGQRVNIETDVIAKYIENLLRDGKAGTASPSLNEDVLKKMGY